MKKRWFVCALVLIVMVTLLTTVAFAEADDWLNGAYTKTLTEDEDMSGDGWNWNASRETLTLENADLDDIMFFITAEDVEICLKGENKMSLDGLGEDLFAIYCMGDLCVDGDGSLTISAELDQNAHGIRAEYIYITDVSIAFSGVEAITCGDDLRLFNCKIRIEEIPEAAFWSCGIWTTDCRISDSEVMIEGTHVIGLRCHNIRIYDSFFKVECDNVALLFLDEDAIVRDSEVYLYGGERAVEGTNGFFVTNIPCIARLDTHSSKSITFGRFGWTHGRRASRIVVDGEPARVVHTVSSALEDAVLTVAAFENGQSAQMSFADVTEQTQYYDAIAEAYNRGLMGGVSATQFAPDATLTRAMVWTVLARANGVNTEIGATWDSAGRDWAMREKVSDGTDPNGAVTVEELITMAWRNAGSPYRVADLGNADVSEWAVEAMRWAYETGILSRQINLKSNATRALTAHVLTAQ